jgi:hypothetical protein
MNNNNITHTLFREWHVYLTVCLLTRFTGRARELLEIMHSFKLCIYSYQGFLLRLEAGRCVQLCTMPCLALRCHISAFLSFWLKHLIRPGSYVAFLPCRIQLNELNSAENRRLNRLPHFCRTFHWSCRIIRQKYDTDSNVEFLPCRI